MVLFVRQIVPGWPCQSVLLAGCVHVVCTRAQRARSASQLSMCRYENTSIIIKHESLTEAIVVFVYVTHTRDGRIQSRPVVF